MPVDEPSDRGVTSHELLTSGEFRHLVTRRWRVSLLLTAALFVVYYGFILLVATNRALLATRVGDVTTLGIVLGVAVHRPRLGADGDLRRLGQSPLRSRGRRGCASGCAADRAPLSRPMDDDASATPPRRRLASSC